MGWLGRLRHASFRGVPFHVDDHEEIGGRRVDVHEFPQRDTPSTEDLGRQADRYRIRAYVIADLDSGDYIDKRDALRQACRAPGTGILVHPYLGTATVNCLRIVMREGITAGGMATFDLEFVEAGLSPSPTLSQDTAASALAGLQSMLRLVVRAYAIGQLIAERPGVLLGFAEIYAAGVASGFTGLPASTFTQIANYVGNLLGSLSGGATPVTSGVTGLVGDPVAIAFSDAFSAAASAIAAQPDTADTDAVTGATISLARLPPDPTQGLLPLASWGSALPAPSGLDLPLQQELQQQMQGLVCGCAVIAIAQIYAGTYWTSANAAAAAKTQLLGLIDAQILAAAAADNDAIYQGWLGLVGLCTADLLQRAQSLPTLTAYSTKTTLPAAALAQLYLQDGSQADSLVALNDAVHPSFMPIAGVYLPEAA